MNLEQLQAMSDSELNELSAVKVMGWENHWQPFSPTTDMNEAMELQSTLSDLDFTQYTVALFKITGSFGNIAYSDIEKLLKLSARDRTIAAILAKESGTE